MEVTRTGTKYLIQADHEEASCIMTVLRIFVGLDRLVFSGRFIEQARRIFHALDGA